MGRAADPSRVSACLSPAQRQHVPPSDRPCCLHASLLPCSVAVVSFVSFDVGVAAHRCSVDQDHVRVAEVGADGQEMRVLLLACGSEVPDAVFSTTGNGLSISFVSRTAAGTGFRAVYVSSTGASARNTATPQQRLHRGGGPLTFRRRNLRPQRVARSHRRRHRRSRARTTRLPKMRVMTPVATLRHAIVHPNARLTRAADVRLPLCMLYSGETTR